MRCDDAVLLAGMEERALCVTAVYQVKRMIDTCLRPQGVKAPAGSRRRRSFLQKVQGKTRPEFPSLVDQSMIQYLVLCLVDTAIPVVLITTTSK